MKNLRQHAAGLALWAVANAAMAAGLTPETFIQADIEAREVTLQGMSARLAMLRAGTSVSDEMAAISNAERAVIGAFAKYGTTANRHAAYAAQHSAEIDAWLAAHPEWQSRLLELQMQFTNLSQEFDALRGR